MNSTSVASHTFKGSRDVLESGGPELRPLPAERSVNSGAVIFVLPRTQAKRLLASAMHISQTHGGSTVSISSFTSTPMPCLCVFGKYGIEERDYFSCQTRWNPASPARRKHFWKVHTNMTPDWMIYDFPESVEVMVNERTEKDVPRCVRRKRAQELVHLKGSRRDCVASTATFFVLDKRESGSLTAQ